MELLAPTLDALLTRPALQTPNGLILLPEEPIDVAAVLADLLDDDDAIWNLGLDGLRAFAESHDDIGWRVLLSFSWPGSELHLAELRVGVDRYLALPMDGWDAPERVIAKLEPPTDELLGDWLEDAVRTNGEVYGFTLFDGRLPARTRNHTALPVRALKDAYFEWMERASETTWAELRDEVVGETGHGSRRAARALTAAQKRSILNAYVDASYDEERSDR